MLFQIFPFILSQFHVNIYAVETSSVLKDRKPHSSGLKEKKKKKNTRVGGLSAHITDQFMEYSLLQAWLDPEFQAISKDSRFLCLRGCLSVGLFSFSFSLLPCLPVFLNAGFIPKQDLPSFLLKRVAGWPSLIICSLSSTRHQESVSFLITLTKVAGRAFTGRYCVERQSLIR